MEKRTLSVQIIKPPREHLIQDELDFLWKGEVWLKYSGHTLEIVKREHLSFFLEKLSSLLPKYSKILKFMEKRPK